MDPILSKVRQARLRLAMGIFGRSLARWLLVSLVLATAIAIVPAIWPLDSGPREWIAFWIASAVGVSLVVATLATASRAPTTREAAVEVDRRFGLGERISSAITVDSGERRTAFAEALVADANRRAEQLVIPERFPLRPRRSLWAPLLVPCLLLVAGWWTLEPAGRGDTVAAVDPEEIRQVRAAASDLKKRITTQRQRHEADGIEESRELFRKVEAELDELTRRDGLDRKEAMIKMNDLRRQLEERKEQLASGAEQFRKAISGMPGFESGPAEQWAKAVKNGDMAAAEKTLAGLAEQLRDGSPDEAQRARLREQIDQLRDGLREQAAGHEQKKQELRQQIEQARGEGRSQDAAEMQRELDEMAGADAQMESMESLAESLGQCSSAMGEGDSAAAAEALRQAAEKFGEAASQASQVQDLESALADLDQAKSQMRCEGCRGDGCAQCQNPGDSPAEGGAGQSSGEGDATRPSSASGGSGIGRGSAPQSPAGQEAESQGYESRVAGEVRQGRIVVAGTADGPNRTGVTREALQESIDSVISERSDPVETQTLPRAEREQAQQYFDRLRDG